MGILYVFDRLPSLRTTPVLLFATAASVAITLRLCLVAETGPLWLAFFALVISLLIAGGWTRWKRQMRSGLQTLSLAVVLAIPFIVTGIVLGSPESGGFPAAFAFFFGLVLGAMHALEARIEHCRPDSADLPVHTHFHRELGWVSALLFVFGVVTLWPWLGEMYGNGYLWILIVGVLAPLLFFWGRLRQPKYESSLVALYRFNRVLPYLGLILLVAIAVG